jgi:hypothetical protein
VRERGRGLTDIWMYGWRPAFMHAEWLLQSCCLSVDACNCYNHALSFMWKRKTQTARKFSLMMQALLCISTNDSAVKWVTGHLAQLQVISATALKCNTTSANKVQIKRRSSALPTKAYIIYGLKRYLEHPYLLFCSLISFMRPLTSAYLIKMYPYVMCGC